MSRVIWTLRALAGLEKAYLFLAEIDEEAAIKALDAIDQGSLLLEDFPEAGRPAEDLEPEHRELLISFGASGYLLLYQVKNALVYILAVRHQKESGY
jgi:toxin ParE1/3/4